jgi:hypothetical protein
MWYVLEKLAEATVWWNDQLDCWPCLLHWRWPSYSWSRPEVPMFLWQHGADFAWFFPSVWWFLSGVIFSNWYWTLERQPRSLMKSTNHLKIFHRYTAASISASVEFSAITSFSWAMGTTVVPPICIKPPVVATLSYNPPGRFASTKYSVMGGAIRFTSPRVVHYSLIPGFLVACCS